MADRRGPASGYDFGNKRQYRRTVWAAFRRHCSGYVATAKALLLPSIEGHEIDYAIRAGFRQENLIVVDRNPAIVATLRRRYPRIRTYGVDLVRASERLLMDGVVVDVANLDLCSQASGTLEHTLSAFCRVGIVKHGTQVAVTVLRGREQGGIRDEIEAALSWTPFVSEQQARDMRRATWIATALARGIGQSIGTVRPVRRDCGDGPVVGGVYRSTAGNQTMLWRLFECCVWRELMASVDRAVDEMLA